MPTRDRHEFTPLQVRGATVEYSDPGGDGDPLLMIHAGVFADWYSPLAAEPALAGHRVIRIVRAGYTNAPQPTAPLTFGDHAAHCADVLDVLDIPQAHVLAHSSGTLVALQLALERPERVTSLVLSEPPLIDQLAAPDDLEELHALFGRVFAASFAAVGAGDLRAAFDIFMTAVCGTGHRDVLRGTLGADGLSRAEHGCGYYFTGEVPAIGSWPFDSTHATRIRHPVQLVAGGASPPPVHRLLARLAAMLPNADVTIIDGQNHLLPLQAPAALADLVTAFARHHPAGQPR